MDWLMVPDFRIMLGLVLRATVLLSAALALAWLARKGTRWRPSSALDDDLRASPRPACPESPRAFLGAAAPSLPEQRAPAAAPRECSGRCCFRRVDYAHRT